jgi:hypothetical protein
MARDMFYTWTFARDAKKALEKLRDRIGRHDNLEADKVLRLAAQLHIALAAIEQIERELD